MASPFRLDRAASPADIQTALATFNREAPGHPDRGREILRRADYWVYHPATGRFGPSKFVAYAGMTFAGYERACTLRDDAPWFKGGIAWRAIESALGRAFAADAALHDRLARWGESLLGTGAFGNADRSEWKFVRLDTPADAPPLADDDVVAEAVERAQAGRQGFVLDGRLRKAIEERAMAAATRYFESLGYAVTDHSVGHPYDLLCQRHREVLYVEVKGTQTDGSGVILTPGELAFARGQRGQMGLFVLHSIRAAEGGSGYTLSGGEERVIVPWDVDAGSLEPLSYMHGIPHG